MTTLVDISQFVELKNKWINQELMKNQKYNTKFRFPIDLVWFYFKTKNLMTFDIFYSRIVQTIHGLYNFKFEHVLTE